MLVDAADFRVTAEPTETNGLAETLQIMVDKPTTVRRERISQVIGRLAVDEIIKLDNALAFVLGLAD
jgi:mRNA interferase MazF